jgi:hypothetical protein
MGVVDLDFVAVESQQDAIVAQLRLAIESVVQDDARVGLAELGEQFSRLFCLERYGRESLTAGIECQPVRSSGLDSGADLFRHALPDG